MREIDFSFTVDLWENDDDEFCFAIIVDDGDRDYVFAQGAFDDELVRARRIVADVKELLA
jgi:hypothetical protein